MTLRQIFLAIAKAGRTTPDSTPRVSKSITRAEEEKPA